MVLDLTPNTPGPMLARLVLALDPTTWLVRKAVVYDELGTPALDGADLEVEPPDDDDTRLQRLAEEFFLLADDKDFELF